jgi:hypothetical protein
MRCTASLAACMWRAAAALHVAPAACLHSAPCSQMLQWLVWCARSPARRRHAPHLLAAATEIKHCCQSLAAVLRDNAPVGPALTQLERLEGAFLALQQAVGSVATIAAVSAAEQAATGADEQQQEAEGFGGQDPPQQQQQQAGEFAAAATGLGGADVAQDSLALHLALSMLFTCCTRVRQQQRRWHSF